MELANEANQTPQNVANACEAKDVPVYISSSVELEADNEALHLGTRLPKELTAATPRAISNNMGRAGVTGDVIYLKHGIYDKKPATLLAFNFQFKFEQNSTNRLSRAEIRVAFNSHGGNQRTASKPAVRHFAPALIYGPVRVGQVTKSFGIATPTSHPTLPVQAGVGLTLAKSTTVRRDFQMKIVGEPWPSDEEAENDDMVIWMIDENSAEPDGIPRDLKAAVLVQRSDEIFQATVQVKVRTRMGMSLFGWPWSKPTPLIISDKASFGNSLITGTFDDLAESDWAQLTEFPGLVSKIRITDTSKERIC